MFLHYDKKDKRKYIYFKLIIVGLMIASFLLSLKLTNTGFPKGKEGVSVGIGFGLIIFTYFVATTKLVKIVIKFKSAGMILILLILYFLSTVIDTLVITLFLATIPVFINDLLVEPYFSILNHTKYFETYWKLRDAKT